MVIFLPYCERMLFTARQKDHHCQTLNPRNLVNFDPKIFLKIFLESAYQGLSIDINYAHITLFPWYPTGCGTTPQISNPRNLVNADPNFLEKIFLDSARQGLSIDISFNRLHTFLVQVIFYSKILDGFFTQIFKKS